MSDSDLVKEHRCKACGGNCVFVPEKGKLVCESCGSEYEIESENGPAINGFDFKKFYLNATTGNGEKLPIYLCKSCGAEVIVADEEASHTCPYCSSKIVLTDKLSGNIRPDGIIPFKIPQKELKAHMEEFYKDKKLLPKNFFSESIMERVTGVYVPFWLFSGRLSGDFRYKGKNVSSYVSGDYRITTTEIYDVDRNASVGFKGIPIDASDKFDDSIMDSLLPYDMNELKPFDTGYLSGFAADRFDVAGNALQKRAEDLMRRTSGGIVESSLAGQYNEINLKSTSLGVNQVDVKYVLLPMYFFTIKFNKIKYRFAVNGQTGKVVGDLPISKNSSRKYFWIRFGAVAAAVMAVSFLTYFIGGPF